MEKYNYHFGFIGGDLRQVYMVKELLSKGYSVLVYAMDTELLDTQPQIASSFHEVLAHAKYIIAPIPFTKDTITLVAKQPKNDLTIQNLKTGLSTDQIIFGGCFPTDFVEHCKTNHIAFYDFMKNEALAIFNTIATAEGSITEAILRQPTNLHDSNALVLGYGKCAKTIAEKLHGLSSNVTVCARSETARALATASGFPAISFEELNHQIGNYEFIFNTVPSVVLTEEVLTFVGKNSILIDIASTPGGIDYEAASRLHLRAFSCLGLPGKYAPQSTAHALIQGIQSYIKSYS